MIKVKLKIPFLVINGMLMLVLALNNVSLALYCIRYGHWPGVCSEDYLYIAKEQWLLDLFFRIAHHDGWNHFDTTLQFRSERRHGRNRFESNDHIGHPRICLC